MLIIVLYLHSKLLFNSLKFIGMEKVLKGFQVFECSATGAMRSVSKIYPTWLGCKRVRNRIAKDNFGLVGFRYTVERVYN